MIIQWALAKKCAHFFRRVKILQKVILVILQNFRSPKKYAHFFLLAPIV